MLDNKTIYLLYSGADKKVQSVKDKIKIFIKNDLKLNVFDYQDKDKIYDSKEDERHKKMSTLLNAIKEGEVIILHLDKNYLESIYCLDELNILGMQNESFFERKLLCIVYDEELYHKIHNRNDKEGIKVLFSKIENIIQKYEKNGLDLDGYRKNIKNFFYALKDYRYKATKCINNNETELQEIYRDIKNISINVQEHLRKLEQDREEYNKAIKNINQRLPNIDKNLKELKDENDNINKKLDTIVKINVPIQKKIPKQLTSKLSIHNNFIGREVELKEIEHKLNESNSLLLINGIGGVGKSAIASYYLSINKDKFDYYGFFDGVESFLSELRVSLNLVSQKEDDLWYEVLLKLRELKGTKLFVIDDIKDIEINQNKIDKILTLKSNGYKILLTSREEIEDLSKYVLNVMNLQDAKKLFNSIYEIKDNTLLEDILKYLDYHTLFIEITARTLKNKQKTLSPKKLKEMFNNGKFAKINIKRKKSFNDYLNKLFNFNKLDDEEILTLKQLSILPSIEIEFKFLQDIFNRNDEKFEEILEYLVEKGWLIKNKDNYKLHQIIKEYILNNITPQFTDIKMIFEYFFNILSYNCKDISSAIKIKKYLLYLDSIGCFLLKQNIQNKKAIDYFLNLGKIYLYYDNFKQAKIYLLSSLKLSKHNKIDSYIANIFNELGIYYINIGELKIAEKYLFKSLNLKINLYKLNNLEVATSYYNIGWLFYLNDDNLKAKEYYLKALKIRKELLGKEHPDIASVYNNLALVYENFKNYQQSKFYVYKALNIYKKTLGYHHNKIASCYNNLARFCQFQKKLDFTTRYFFLKAFVIRKNILGITNLDTITICNSMAAYYYEIKEYHKAEKIMLFVLKYREKILGNEHPSTAITYNNLAWLYLRIEKLEKSKIFFQKAIKVFIKKLQKKHKNIKTAKKGLITIKKIKLEKLASIKKNSVR